MSNQIQSAIIEAVAKKDNPFVFNFGFMVKSKVQEALNKALKKYPVNAMGVKLTVSSIDSSHQMKRNGIIDVSAADDPEEEAAEFFFDIYFKTPLLAKGHLQYSQYRKDPARLIKALNTYVQKELSKELGKEFIAIVTMGKETESLRLIENYNRISVSFFHKEYMGSDLPVNVPEWKYKK